MTKRQVAQHKPGTAMRIGGPLPRTKPRAQGGLAGLLAGVSVSAAALALAAIPQQARAQSAVNATPTGINATVTQSATFDQVTVSGSQATVDWALNPSGVSSEVFLNGGTTLDFQGSGSYTVLNRVNPMIADNGGGFVGFGSDLSLAADNRIGLLAQNGESSIDVSGNLSLAAGRGASGGAIAVTVASGAAFNVGGDFDAHSDGIGAIQSDGEVLTPGAAGEAAIGGSVKITLGDATYSVGGQTLLSANAQGGLGGASAGSARGGSVSFSSTSLTTLSPNAPLNLQASADATTPQFGAGPITGASATGGSVDLAFGGSFKADSISASSVAVANPGQDGVAQNATGGSISLAFSGSGSTVNVADIGLTASAAAGNTGIASGSAITFKVDGAKVNAPQPFGECNGPCPQPNANISINNFRNGTGTAAGSIGFSVINDGALDLAGDFSSVDLFSSARAEAGGTASGAAISFTVDGGAVNVPSFSIESNGSGDFGGLLSFGKGGDITVALRNGASINASSNFSLYSSGTGGNGDAAGDGTGGAVLLSIANGSLTSPFVRLSSVGFAGNQFSGGTRIGTGFGGSAAINLINSAAVLSADFVSVSAPGQAGRSEAAFAAFGPLAISGSGGGNGQGGTASITVDAGILNATDTLTIAASGEGGDGFGGGAGGTGSGGTASLTVNGGSVSPVILEIGADGRGGFGASNDSEGGTPAAAGGAGTGGSASLLQTGGFLTTGSIALSATGNAPETIFFGEGGSFTIEYGGDGTVFGDGPATGGTGGLGEGGETSLTITGGNLANISGAPVTSISLDSRGVGGNGGDAFSNSSSSQLTRGSGGTGRGGTSTFVFSGGSVDFTSVNLDASGAGGISGQEFGEVSSDSSNGGDGGSGFGGAGGAGGRTGAGTGGTITLHAEGGLIRTGDFGLFARGFGSLGGQGGAGATGSVQAGAPTGTPAAPNGRPGSTGSRGSGIGGTINLTAITDESGRAGGFDLGAVTVGVDGAFDRDGFLIPGFAGVAQIVDRVDGSNGGVGFGSLDVLATGSPSLYPTSLTIFSSAQPISVKGSLNVSAGGAIDITASGTGGLTVSDSLSLSSGTDIRLTGISGGLIAGRGRFPLIARQNNDRRAGVYGSALSRRAGAERILCFGRRRFRACRPCPG